ncbi:hypothetical protein MMC30_003595 [Trapelia coarctata]|nr:hypothetical protein [Trapelia coarctata]
MGYPLKSIFDTRNRSEHDKRRKIWERALSATSLRTYEPRIELHIHELEKQIVSSSAQAINVSAWFRYYSWDISSDLTFGRSFDMLENEDNRFVFSLVRSAMAGVGLFGPVPWLFILLGRIPSITANYNIFLEFVERQMLERKARQTEIPDLMSWLLDSDHRKLVPTEDHLWLAGDSRTAMIAGSDAVSSTLTYCFYYLANSPVHISLIRQELASITKTQGGFCAKALQTSVPYLNAFITETLRLHPPNQSGNLRQTPLKGLYIGKRFLPGQVTLCIPLWSLHRSPDCYVHPQSFLPQRWTTQPDLVLHRNAYKPFNGGPYGCVGKQLALLEIRAVIARLVDHFDIMFAAGEDGSKLLRESDDGFTTWCGDLMLGFRERSD